MYPFTLSFNILSIKHTSVTNINTIFFLPVSCILCLYHSLASKSFTHVFFQQEGKQMNANSQFCYVDCRKAIQFTVSEIALPCT